MRTDSSESETKTAAIVPRSNVVLSKWVNEKLPAWNEFLGAHELARLTRRPRWILAALAFVGQFPKPRRFRGRAIGWHRRDVQRWLLEAAGLPENTDSANCSGIAGGRLQSRAERRRATRRCARRDRRSTTFCRRPSPRQAHVRGITTSTRVPPSSQGEPLEFPFTDDGRIEP